MTALSVIVSTHNPRADLLTRTLDSLHAQSLPVEAWELLIVDNASSHPVAGTVDLSWHPHARVVREDELGLTAARVRGIRETSADLLAFVDDDNVLREDYLTEALRLSRVHTMIGCFGAGVIVPEFEEQPEPDVLPHTHVLALRQVARTIWSNSPDDGLFPWGAGLVVRRPVAISFTTLTENGGLNTAVGRRGTSLASGEDELFGWIALGQGLGKGLFTELSLVHLIPRERIAFDYLLRLSRAQAQSYTLIHEWHGRAIPVPERPARPVDVLRHLARLNLTRAWEATGSYLTRRRLDARAAQMDDAWRHGLADYAARRQSR